MRIDRVDGERERVEFRGITLGGEGVIQRASARRGPSCLEPLALAYGLFSRGRIESNPE